MEIYYIVINTIKKEKISAFAALTAKTFKHYLFTYHRKLLIDFIRNSYIVILPVVKVYYAATLNAPEMVMNIHIRIIAFCLPIPLNYICNPNLSECQEGPVHCVE